MATKEELEILKTQGNFSSGVKDLFDVAIKRKEFKSGMASQDVVANALSQISKILAQAQVQQNAGVDTAEVERIVKQELNNAQIGISNLDQSVKNLLQGQVVQANLTIMTPQGIVSTTTKIDKEFLARPLTQLILSDASAMNNVYLYGGAGTGKTYTAGEIANLLGWSLIEVNCNQFTSPLELMGGQTISGYQEGLVIQAWKNEIKGEAVNGCVLLLDELPKIDPNTAGILNSALAKIKLQGKRSMITNGRGEKFEKKNILIIGTGNTKLNETSEDYEANFKQDLSLQDRFAGSTYEIFVYYTTEVETTMKGFLFIWLYMIKVREWIEEKKQSGRAFVSIRLMENMRDTYRVYRTYEENGIKTNSGDSLIESPKTLQQACESFFSLFPDGIVTQMKNETGYNDFIKTILEKNTIPIVDVDNLDFDTPSETKDALALAKRHDEKKNKIYSA
jgi:hypothetical protein